jgi:uncharacterized protein (TIGR00369 family)
MPTPLEMIRTLGSAAVQGSPHAKALGLEFVDADVGRATLRAPYRPDLVGDPETGVIAGGVVTALLDHACGQAVWAALEGYTTIATLDLRIDYMRAAEPGLPVFATAHCYKLTRSVAFVRATAYDHDPADPVAAAQAAFMLDANAGRKAGANLKPRKAAEGVQDGQS